MKTNLTWRHNDGGRSDHFKGTAGDCVTRAVAIAAEMPYEKVYSDLSGMVRTYRGKRGKRVSARDGVPKEVSRRYMKLLGWTYVPTMGIGTGCKVHLCQEDLPKGRLIVQLSKHLTAVVDHVILDTYDPQRITVSIMNGLPRHERRCVYGYWMKKS